MQQVHPKWCEDHRCKFLGVCPFCKADLEPVRFELARRDFAGVPLAGTVDILPHYHMVSLEDVVSTLGHQLAFLEERELEALKPYTEAKRIIYGQMRKAKMEPRVFQLAVRKYLGLWRPGAEEGLAVEAILSIMRNSDSGRAEDL